MNLNPILAGIALIATTAAFAEPAITQPKTIRKLIEKKENPGQEIELNTPESGNPTQGIPQGEDSFGLSGGWMFSPQTHILVVDDMMTMRKLVSKTCKELGFTQITEASDGALAWEAIQSANPPIGVIISDWNMPNCTGIDLLKRVRADSRYKTLPFVLVTAKRKKLRSWKRSRQA